MKHSRPFRLVPLLAVTFAAVFLHQRFLREASGFVAGPEVLVFLFPVGMMLFVIGLAPRMWRANQPIS